MSVDDERAIREARISALLGEYATDIRTFTDEQVTSVHQGYVDAHAELLVEITGNELIRRGLQPG
jgi:hypothetical protein